MTPYELSLRTRIVSGNGAIRELGRLAREVGQLAHEVGATRVFLVTDAGLVAAGHAETARAALLQSGVEVRTFDAVHANPTSRDVLACRAALGDWPADLLVGIGGGSSIDTAKGCAFVHAGGGDMADYRGVGTARGELLPLIAVPTTAGTGTEVQSFALIEEPGTHRKMACGDPQAAPAIAILDPELTTTQPRRVTACTGLDTVGHAVETAVTTKRNAVSWLYSTASFRLAAANLPRVLEEPLDLAARAAMLEAAAFGGIAIEHSMLGAAHSMANALTARFDFAHGQAVGMALPHVVRFNAADPLPAAAYAELARDAGLCSSETPDADAVAALLRRLHELLEATGFAGPFRDHGVPAEATDELAEEAARQWTAQFNPRAVGAGEFRTLFGGA